jgi:hypothetical protein
MAPIAIARCPDYFRNALASPAFSPAHQQCESMTEPERLNILAARRSSTGEQLLQISKRNPRLGCDFGRAEIRICKVTLRDTADALKEPVVVGRYRHSVSRYKKRVDQIIHDDVNFGLAPARHWFVPCGLKQLAKQLGRQTIGPTYPNLGLET